jgi:hypothetical protein
MTSARSAATAAAPATLGVWRPRPWVVAVRQMHGMDMGVATARGSFVASYLGIWTFIGVAVYAVYRPHGALIEGVVTLAAGALRAHAGQATVPPPLPRERPIGIHVRASLPRRSRPHSADVAHNTKERIDE